MLIIRLALTDMLRAGQAAHVQSFHEAGRKLVHTLREALEDNME